MYIYTCIHTCINRYMYIYIPRICLSMVSSIPPGPPILSNTSAANRFTRFSLYDKGRPRRVVARREIRFSSSA